MALVGLIGPQVRIQKGVRAVQSNPHTKPHFDSKFHFHGKFWINLILRLFDKSILLPVNVYEIAGWVANSVDPDQTPPDLAQACPSEYVE